MASRLPWEVFCLFFVCRKAPERAWLQFSNQSGHLVLLHKISPIIDCYRLYAGFKCYGDKSLQIPQSGLLLAKHIIVLKEWRLQPFEVYLISTMKSFKILRKVVLSVLLSIKTKHLKSTRDSSQRKVPSCHVY